MNEKISNKKVNNKKFDSNTGILKTRRDEVALGTAAFVYAMSMAASPLAMWHARNPDTESKDLGVRVFEILSGRRVVKKHN